MWNKNVNLFMVIDSLTTFNGLQVSVQTVFEFVPSFLRAHLQCLQLVSRDLINFSDSVKSTGAFPAAQKSHATSISVSKTQNFVIKGKTVEEMHGSRTLRIEGSFYWRRQYFCLLKHGRLLNLYHLQCMVK